MIVVTNSFATYYIISTLPQLEYKVILVYIHFLQAVYILVIIIINDAKTPERPRDSLGKIFGAPNQRGNNDYM